MEVEVGGEGGHLLHGRQGYHGGGQGQGQDQNLGMEKWRDSEIFSRMVE